VRGELSRVLEEEVAEREGYLGICIYVCTGQGLTRERTSVVLGATGCSRLGREGRGSWVVWSARLSVWGSEVGVEGSISFTSKAASSGGCCYRIQDVRFESVPRPNGVWHPSFASP
jgi:hypothetical protein